jgi:hypothetical protein
MTYAIVNKSELAVVSMSDHRTDSDRFPKEAGIDENDPSLVRLLKALEATEKWQAGTMTEYLEIAFIEFELQAAFKAFDQAAIKASRVRYGEEVPSCRWFPGT